MDRALGASLAASLLGLGLMGLVALNVEPPQVPLSGLHDHVGSTVRAQGRLLELRVYDSGFSRFLLVDGNATVAASLPEPPAATAGDWVEAAGTVERLRDRVELRLEGADAVVVVRPWRSSIVPLSQVLEAPWSFREADVRTSGLLERSGATWWLKDPASHLRLRAGGASLDEAAPGFVIADGRLAYEADDGQFRLQVLSLEAAPLPEA